MPNMTSGMIIDALARGELDRLIGAAETEQIDFKRTPYLLNENHQKWELAKDVAAFANKHGGVIVVGVETERQRNEIAEIATAVRPIRKELVDLRQHRGVIDTWVYPRLQCVDLRWYPPNAGEPQGVLVIDIPPQEEVNVPFIVRGMHDPQSEFRGAVGIPRRDGERIVWDTAQDIHREIRRQSGIPAAAGSTLERTAARVNQMEQLQEWQSGAVFFLQAIPPDGPETIADFYGSVRDSFINRSILRQRGFARRWRVQAEAFEGGWITRTRDGLTWIDPDGLLTQGLLASEDTILGWYYNQNRREGAPVILHPVVIVEMTLEFFRFLYSEIKPRAGRGSWQYRVSCRRFQSQSIVLPVGFPRREEITGDYEGLGRASSDDWNRQFQETGTANRDAFEALQRLYALFGNSGASIPFVDNGAVSEEQLIGLG